MKTIKKKIWRSVILAGCTALIGVVPVKAGWAAYGYYAMWYLDYSTNYAPQGSWITIAYDSPDIYRIDRNDGFGYTSEWTAGDMANWYDDGQHGWGSC